MAVNPPVDFIVITALEEERKAFLKKLPQSRKLPPTDGDIRVYHHAELPVEIDGTQGNYDLIVLSLLNMGRVQAATATSDAIRRWEPRFVLLVGIAGGIESEDIGLGDVLISEQIVDYELQKIQEEGNSVRYQVHRADPRLFGSAQNFDIEDCLELLSTQPPIEKEPKRFMGAIASGDKVIAFNEVIQKYQKDWPKLIGVEMEAAGVAIASFQAANAPGFFMVRGVSDLADQKKDSAEVKAWRNYACDIAAAYTIALLQSGPIPFVKKKITSPSNLPYSGTPHFFGREDVIKNLKEQLQHHNQLAICAVSGMGGIGKTELAIQYALKNREEYSGGLCWLDCRRGDLGTQIVIYARSLLKLEIPDGLELVDQVTHCWNHWREGTVLVIYDDVTDYKAIASYLPPRNKDNFKVLITSRERAGSNYKRIDLNVLEKESALKLLRSLVGSKRINGELEKAKALCEWLGYLPLGLELVGRYLANDSTLTIEKVQKRLESKRLAAQALILKNKGDTTAQHESLEYAFELSWDDLSDDEKNLGCRLSLFASASIPWLLVEQCVIKTDNEEEKEERQEELEVVRNEGLIDKSLLRFNEKNEYQLHPLIREFFIVKQKNIQNLDEYKKDLCRVMVAIAQQIPSTITSEVIESTTSYIPHLREVGENLMEWVEDEDLIRPFTVLGRIYEDQTYRSLI